MVRFVQMPNTPYLPTGHNGETYGCLHLGHASGLERFGPFADDITEGINVLGLNSDLRIGEGLADVNFRKNLSVVKLRLCTPWEERAEP